MDAKEKALKAHAEWQGKIEVTSRAKVNTKEELAIAYTPGVAEPCLEISKDVDNSYVYTRRGNLVLVVTDGTAVLGLGDIGPEAGMPVMEGKCVLFKEFANVDAFPLCIRSKNVDEIVQTIKLIAGSFGGVNLEDISAPRCFEIEKRLKEELDIPVFHDDQHGTAIVTVAAMINALRLVDKKPENVKMVVNGAGAAALAVTRLMMTLGIKDITICDIDGRLYQGRENLTEMQIEILDAIGIPRTAGNTADSLQGADIFLGLSGPNCVTTEMVKTMNKDAIVFAMANPTPEIFPADAIAGGARIVGTGRSDFPNQINNVLAFPGVFRGTLDVRASDINDEMNLAAAYAIANFVTDDLLTEDYIIPDVFDPAVAPAVAKAVAEAARKSGLARQ